MSRKKSYGNPEYLLHLHSTQNLNPIMNKSNLFLMPTRRILLLTFLIFTTSILCQNSTSNTSNNTLLLGQQLKLSIEAGKNISLYLTINATISESESLFITAQSPYNDPFEEPTMTVKAENQYEQRCTEEENDFMGICQIQASDVKVGRVFEVVLFCEIDCDLKVRSYISTQYRLEIGSTNQLKNYEKTAMIASFQVTIDKNQNFSSFMVLAQPKSTEDILEGTTIYANFGQNPKKPTTSDFMVKSQSVSGHSIGIFLSNKELKPGHKLIFIIVIGPGVEMTLITRIFNENKYHLYLGSPIYDYTATGENKTYILDLGAYERVASLGQNIITVKFIPYSGRPTVIISADQQFSSAKIIAEWKVDSSRNIEITPKMLQSLANPTKIFILVSAYWSTNYQLEASINRKQFIDMELQIAELFHINGAELKNIIVEDENLEVDLPKDGVVEYKVSVQVENGDVIFMVRDCGSYKQGKILDCLVNSKQELNKQQVKQSFNKIQYSGSRSQTTLILTFKYNISENCKKDSQKNITFYTCKFHILLSNTDPNLNPTNIQLSIHKNTIKQWLREGQPQRGTIQEGEMNYYAFDLPDVEGIVSLEFYVTVVQGEVTIMVSQKEAYPSFETNGNVSDVRYSFWNSLVYAQSVLKPGYYYIGVYGISMTDYSIGVAISRSKNKTNTTYPTINDKVQVTDIKLERGIVQTISMPIGKAIASFVFTSNKDKQRSVIKITEIQGNVDFTVSDKQNGTEKCNSKTSQSVSNGQCEFESTSGHTYFVTVTGHFSTMQVFTILYTNSTECDMYPWNIPLKVMLDSGDTVCLKFKMYELEDIHTVFSLSPIQLLTLKMEMMLRFGDKNITLVQHDRAVSKRQLELLCPQKGKQCTFTLTISYPSSDNSKKSTSFLMAVQNYRSESVLFSGIASKVTTDKISPKVSDKFFFYVFKDKAIYDVSIIFTSQTQSKYQIASKVVKNSDFVRDINESLYPKFNEQNGNAKYINTSDSSPLTLLTVNQSKFIYSNNDISIVLISVFGIPPESTKGPSTYVYKIQVNQGEDRLLLGDSKLGVISKDVSYEYEIQLHSKETTSVQVRSMSDDNCIQAYVSSPSDDHNVKQLAQPEIFSDMVGLRQVIVQTNADYCSYQITYNSADVPINSIIVSVPYDISLDDSQTKYFSYYHANNNSFYILQMVKAGSSTIFAHQIKKDDDMKNLTTKNHYTYSFVGQMNSDLQVQTTSPAFCSNCHYLIAVKGQPSVRAQLTINPADIPILLKQHFPSRDRLDVNESNIYQYRSAGDFTVVVVVLYGKVEVKVNDSTGKMISRVQHIVESQEIEVDMGKNGKQGQKNNYFDQSNSYLITVNAVQDSSYYIVPKPSTQKSLNKAYQGIPLTLELKQGVETQVQFYNVYTTGILNVMAQDLKFLNSNEENDTYLRFLVEKNGENVLNKWNVSQDSYNLELAAREGLYKLKVTSDVDTEISIVFARNQFNHLQAGRSYFMDRASVFELYSRGDNSVLVQIFPCKDDISVLASTNLSLLLLPTTTQANIIRVEHGNYGGHYVVNVQKLDGQFYLKTTPILDTNNGSVPYIITYHYYSQQNGEPMPYNNYYITHLQVGYKYVEDTVEFTLNAVNQREVKGQANVTYKLYISSNGPEIEKMTKCGIGKLYTATIVKEIGASQNPTYRLNIDQIKKIINYSESYLVGAEATVTLQQKNPRFLKQLNFVYQLAQLMISSNLQHKQQRAPSALDYILEVALWIVLPFLVGSVLLFFAARYLIRSFGAYPMQLVEEDGVGGESEGPVGQSQDVLQSGGGAGKNQENI